MAASLAARADNRGYGHLNSVGGLARTAAFNSRPGGPSGNVDYSLTNFNGAAGYDDTKNVGGPAGTAACNSRLGISGGHVDCPLTGSESTTDNADSAAACTDKPGGTGGNVELLAIFNGVDGYRNPISVGGPAGTAACNSKPGGISGGHVDYPLTSSTSRTANADSAAACTDKPGGIVYGPAGTAACHSRPGGISGGHVDCPLTGFASTTANTDSAAACTDEPGGTVEGPAGTAACNSRPGISGGHVDCPLTSSESTTDDADSAAACTRSISDDLGDNSCSHQPLVYQPGDDGCHRAPSNAKGPSILTTITCMLVILVGSLQAPFFVAAPTRSTDEGFLPNFQVAQDTSHHALLESAQSFAEALGLGPPLDILSVASFPGQEILALTRFDTTPMDFLNSIQGTFLARSPFQLSTWDTLRGTHAQVPCGAAFHLVASYANKLLKTATRSIQDVPMKLSQAQRGNPLDLSDANGWTLISSLIRQTELAIKAALAAVLPSDAHYEYLISCATRVLADSRPQLNDIPAYLRRVGDPVVHRDASSLPFTNRSSPVHTSRLEPAKQLRTTSYRPNSYHDILMPEAIDAIHAWLHVEKSNMIAIAKYGPNVRRARNALKMFGFGEAVEKHDTLVIGQDQFLEPAQGIIWDCRGFEHGLSAVPMDFTSAPNSDLNNDFILEALESWPDQELVGFLVNGVQFRADLPLQILLGPHLSSLSAAWGSVESEILRLEDLGYYDIFSALPFLPMRSVPQGSTPRKI